LFIGDTQLVLNTASNALIGTRYYSLGGATIATRTGNVASGNVAYLIPDRQGTDQLVVDSATLTVTRRQFLPFGGARGAVPTAWPGGDKGYVGGAPDPTTGLENLGAREYDPASGRFLTADPVFELGNSDTTGDNESQPDTGSPVQPGTGSGNPSPTKQRGANQGKVAEAAGSTCSATSPSYLCALDAVQSAENLVDGLASPTQMGGYDYSGNDPTTGEDPTGLWSWKGVFHAVASVVDIGSSIAGLIPGCPPCQAVSVGLGLVGAAAHLGAGEGSAALMDVVGVGLSVATGGFGNFAKIGKVQALLEKAGRGAEGLDGAFAESVRGEFRAQRITGRAGRALVYGSSAALTLYGPGQFADPLKNTVKRAVTIPNLPPAYAPVWTPVYNGWLGVSRGGERFE
jgi:RHS repeat-associated protein